MGALSSSSLRQNLRVKRTGPIVRGSGRLLALKSRYFSRNGNEMEVVYDDRVRPGGRAKHFVFCG